MAQEQKQPRKSHEEEEPTDAAAAPAEAVTERKEKLDEDIDAILEDIDDVLETNAEDFGKSFIQKGGQCPSMSDARLPDAFLPPGTSSFAEFLGQVSPELLPSRRPLPPG